MKVEVLYRPSYAVGLIKLDPNERVQAESGAMVSMAGDVSVDTKMQGGFLKSLARSVFTNESFFVNFFQAGSRGGEVMVAPTLPGDVFSLEMTNDSLLVQSGSFLASSDGVQTDAKWSGARTFFSGEGLIMLHCAGTGTLVLSSYGAIHEVDLNPGEKVTVDTGHIVAFSEKMGFNVRPIGGLKTTFLGGEGLVVDLTGPGKVLMQTRSMGAFLDWLLPKIPKEQSHS
jgi:uncharacterized protein (TIGR00266 family)